MNTPQTTKDMLGRSALISVNEAQHIMLRQLEGIRLSSETISLPDSLDRILAVSVESCENLPPHPRSVMDGFAVIARDTFGASESMPCYLQISGSVAMGEMPVGTVEKCNCYRIATGGFMPAGADAVVMHEHTVPVDDTMVEVTKSCGSGTSIIGIGDDIRKGEIAVPAGRRLRPQDLGLLAALGVVDVEVFRKIRVGVMSTGDEIIPHHETPRGGQIRNINSITLAAMAKRCGAEVFDYGIVSDNRDTFLPTLHQAVRENDLVLFSGGSSVGVRDLGEQAIEAIGPPGILVHGVKLKPGKPVIIGFSDKTPVFGLPGHPVSALVCFDLFIKPAIDRISGIAAPPHPSASIMATLGRNINSAAGRLDLVRVQLRNSNTGPVADPVLGRSGAISTLARAHGYFLIDEDSQGVTQGSTIEVFLYS